MKLIGNLHKTVLGIVLFFLSLQLFCPTFAQNSSKYERVISKAHAVDDPDRQVGNFDPNNSPSLPLGIVKEINDTKYIVCVDSAYFLEDGAYFSAYMALDFPQSDRKIAFAAEDIKFNPKGVNGGEQSKLMLVSDHTIKLGPNTWLYLPGDGSNYVNWGCNGFESVNLHGSFLLNGEILQPVNEADSVVSAEFNINVEDMHNLMTEVDFSPFTVAGLKDFEFTVSNATVDMSDYANPSGVTMPAVYTEMYPDINLWRGFHLALFQVKLPDKMASGEGEGMEIYGQDMFINDAGVTGDFGANNVLSLGNGDASGWGMSIDNIEVELTTNSITAGAMSGTLAVPILDNNGLEYDASITKNEVTNKAEYAFAASPEGPMSVSGFNSTLTVHESSALSMTIKDGKFDPSLNLTGDWKLDNPRAEFDGIGFQNVKLITESPYVSSGQFSLVGSVQAEMAKFKVSLNELKLGIYANGNIGIDANVGMNLGDENDPNSLSVESGFEVKAKMEPLENGKLRLKYKDIAINSIAITCNTNAFNLNGSANFHKDHPVYGDGFKGNISLLIPAIMDNNIAMYCYFGSVDDYRYWAVDVTAPIATPQYPGIPIGAPPAAVLHLTSISGGLFYHMRDTRSVDDIIATAEATINIPDTAMSPSYVPDPSISVGFNAGVSFKYVNEKAINGELIFGIQFNSNGGLSSILMAGEAYSMVTKNGRSTATNYAKGVVAAGYDNENKILDFQATFVATFAGAFTANLWSQLYLSPDLWYFHLGTPDNPCTVNLYNFATANGYFMLGQDLPPMPPPPPQVSSVLSGMADGRDEDQIVTGDGIATGMSLSVGFDKSVSISSKWELYATGYLGAGFDLTLYKYANTYHCAGSTGPFGANYWYLNGQLYAYGSVSAGARKKNGSKDFSIISASMAMLLQGKLPKPTFVHGEVYLQASIFGIFNVDMTMDFQAGNNCQIVN